MIALKKISAAVVMAAALSFGGIASATVPPSDAVVVAANEDPTRGHHYNQEEFERQSAVLAPDENDHTRLFVFGGLGVVLAGLLGFVAVNRKKWGGPTA